jgi:hypothetical protein
LDNPCTVMDGFMEFSFSGDRAQMMSAKFRSTFLK